MRSGRLKAVIFDLDGTLVDSVGRMFLSCQAAMRRLGLSAPEHARYFEYYESYRLGQLVEHAQRADFFEFLLEEYEGFDGEIVCVEGALEALRYCRANGLATGIVTSRQSHSSHVEAELRRLGIASYIDVIRTQQGTRPIDSLAKEHRLGESLDLLGVSARESAYVGDLPDDITSGKRAGLALTVAVKSGRIRPELLEAMEPDALLNHVGELPSYLALKLPD